MLAGAVKRSRCKIVNEDELYSSGGSRVVTGLVVAMILR